MKNTLVDLHDSLIAQIERLSDEEMSDEALERESKRAIAISKIAGDIINNSSNILKATQLRLEYDAARSWNDGSVDIFEKKKLPNANEK